MANTNEATPQAREQGEQGFSAAGLIIAFLAAIVVTRHDNRVRATTLNRCSWEVGGGDVG